MSRLALAIGAGLVAVTSAAAADPLPVVERSGDANLERTDPHSGISVTGVLVGSSIISADASGDVGRGPGVSLRLGEAATPDTIITLEIVAGSMLHDHEEMVVEGGTAKKVETLFTNSAVDFLVGAQHYAKETLWLRGAAGIGNYIRRGQFDAGGAATADEHLFGAAALVGIGLDVLRRHHFVLGIEGFTSVLIERHGLTTTSGLGLGFSYQ